MAAADRDRWDARYGAVGTPEEPALPPAFAGHVDRFPATGTALEVACGRGRAAVWLARRGLDVVGLDVSPVAVALARDLAAAHGVADRCHFAVADLDDGLPDGPPVDVVLCHLFRDSRLDVALEARLRPGGLLAIAALSEVGAAAGPFRVAPGALLAAFAGLHVHAAAETDGTAWLLATRRRDGP